MIPDDDETGYDDAYIAEMYALYCREIRPTSDAYPPADPKSAGWLDRVTEAWDCREK